MTSWKDPLYRAEKNDISVFLWYRAKLRPRKDLKFRDFVHTSINENKYAELARILRKNQNRLDKKIESDTLDLIFDRKVVESLNRFPDWLHLSLLTNESLFKKFKNPFGTVDVVMRNLISKEDSILQSYVASRVGGLEYAKLTKIEQELIEKTFQDPQYYIDLRIDYPLLILSCERIDSGELDLKYNQNDDFYIRSQGISGRIKCPIYLFIKIHYMALDRCDLMLNEAKHWSAYDDELKENIRRSIQNLDKGKRYVFRNIEWLSKELGI